MINGDVQNHGNVAMGHGAQNSVFVKKLKVSGRSQKAA